MTIDGRRRSGAESRFDQGAWGAPLREKIVADNSRRLVIIADAGKTVTKLGTHSMLPVEVAPFAHEVQEPFLRSLGATPALCRGPDGAAFVTDNSNYIYDCRFPDGIDDAGELERRLRGRAGIVETGLFLGIAAVALIADESSVQERGR